MDKNLVKKLLKNAETLAASTLEVNQEAKNIIDHWAGVYDANAQISKALSLQLAAIANGIAMQNQLLTLVLSQGSINKKTTENNWSPNFNTGHFQKD